MKRNTSIGGQAVLEGVMMRGRDKINLAVRKSTGKIVLQSLNAQEYKLSKVFLLRGIINMLTSLKMGFETINQSMAMLEIEEEPTKFERWLAKVTGKDVSDLISIIGICLGVGLFAVLFVALPNFLVSLASRWITSAVLMNVLEGILRLLIFTGYLSLINLLPDIRRVFQYHGAEHKTINCYENGETVTVENAQRYTTMHPRCGTSFLFIVMIISIILFSLTGWSGPWYGRILIRLLLIPVVAAVSYEVLMFLAKRDNICFRMLRWPGMQVQRLTTKEPDDAMLEVAIAAFAACLSPQEWEDCMPEDYVLPGVIPDDVFTRHYAITLSYGSAMQAARTYLEKSTGEDCTSDVTWLMAAASEFTFTELKQHSEQDMPDSIWQLFREYVVSRGSGRPAQYIIGSWDFCDVTLLTDERALIPRPETEMLADAASRAIKDGDRILDLGTGTGCIGIYLKHKNPTAQVVLADISPDALELAAQNMAKIGVQAEMICYDMATPCTCGQFDVIISNPPYIPTADIDTLSATVKDHEPLIALDGGEDGLTYYRHITRLVRDNLAPGGKLFLEMGIGQQQDVSDLLAPLCDQLEILPDLQGIPRIITCIKREDN